MTTNTYTLLWCVHIPQDEKDPSDVLCSTQNLLNLSIFLAEILVKGDHPNTHKTTPLIMELEIQRRVFPVPLPLKVASIAVQGTLWQYSSTLATVCDQTTLLQQREH